jgi:hypothetical protein
MQNVHSSGRNTLLDRRELHAVRSNGGGTERASCAFGHPEPIRLIGWLNPFPGMDVSVKVDGCPGVTPARSVQISGANCLMGRIIYSFYGKKIGLRVIRLRLLLFSRFAIVAPGIWAMQHGCLAYGERNRHRDCYPALSSLCENSRIWSYSYCFYADIYGNSRRFCRRK